MMHDTLHTRSWLILHGQPTEVYDATWFAALFAALDRLHDRVCQEAVLPLPRAELLGWLEDIIFTAQQVVDEVRAHGPDTGVTNATSSAGN